MKCASQARRNKEAITLEEINDATDRVIAGLRQSDEHHCSGQA